MRASTPDPREAPCGENCLEDSVFEESHSDKSCPRTLSQTPESFSIPLQNPLGYLDTTAPSVPVIHPPLEETQPERVRGLKTPVITRAPSVPWSPPRLENTQASSESAPASKPGALIEILTESASLLHPLFEASSDEQDPNIPTMRHLQLQLLG